jgi:hypothetical protein
MSDTFDHEADAFERMLDSEYNYNYEDNYDHHNNHSDSTRFKKTCWTCKKTDLYWGQNENNVWRLFDQESNQEHECIRTAKIYTDTDNTDSDNSDWAFEQTLLPPEINEMGDEVDYQIEQAQTGFEGYVGEQPIVECRFCNQGGLVWEEVSEGYWRMVRFEDSEIHKCQEYYKHKEENNST